MQLKQRTPKGPEDVDVGGSNNVCNEQTKRQSYNYQLKIGFLLMVGFFVSHMLLATPTNSKLDERLLENMNDQPTAKKANVQANDKNIKKMNVEATIKNMEGATKNMEAAMKSVESAATTAEKKAEPNNAVPPPANTRGGKKSQASAAKLPIHKQTLRVIAPDHATWTDEAVHEEFQNALQKIKDAPIIHEPFDHFFVKDLFSAKFYQALMEELPPPSTYKSAPYPGTDPVYRTLHVSPDIQNGTHVHLPEQCFTKKPNKHDTDLTARRRKAGCWLEDVQLHSSKATNGLTLTVDQDASKYPLWAQAFRLVHSRNFTHLMYSKFATDTGIPEYKQKKVSEQAEGDASVANLRNTAALRIEPTSYHLSPHVDRYEKLVTWQFFHPENMELHNRTVGTSFYKIKKRFQHKFEINDVLNPRWLDYSFFEPVKHQPVIPNYFFSFAPNNHSWHGASIEPEKMVGANQYARRTFLGFITTSYWGFHHFNKGDWAPEEFDFHPIA